MKKMTITLSMLVVIAFGFTKLAQLQISTQQYQTNLETLGITQTK